MENEYVKDLKKAYKNVFKNVENRPKWAVKKSNEEDIIFPAIPFVGNHYEKTRLLLYASAENLVGYKNDNSTYLDEDKYAIDRRRNQYNWKEKPDYFPYIHISPVNDGSLIIVAAYILKLLKKKIKYSNPHEFIETIAVDNFAKFSIETNTKNKDYVGDISKLKASFEYVEKDLAILNPEILIMPERIYNHKDVKNSIKQIVPLCKVIPIFQINCTTINCHISKKYERKDPDEIGIFGKWQKKLSNGITGETNNNFYSVYTYLEDVVKNVNNN
jgi:hypothetical protein